MEINRNNYQICITDFYDGNLSRIEEDALVRFLDENPDLRAEFDDFDNFSLHPDISVRIDKNGLKKDLSHLNSENIEAYAIAITENDMEGDQAEEIKMTLGSTPEGRKLISDYSRIKLVPQNIVYPDKRGLKRIPVKKNRYRILINSLSAAASVAIIVTLLLIVRNRPDYGDGPFSATVSLNMNKTLLNTETDGNKRLISHLRGNMIPFELSANNIIREKTEQPAGIERDIVYITPASKKPDVNIPLQNQQYILASVTPTSIPDIPVDEISNLSPREFVARNFRKLVLMEDENNTEKLKVHEMADASILGLNKVLGWEMALEKEKAEDGTLASYKFTSQLLNFDHKVKE